MPSQWGKSQTRPLHLLTAPAAASAPQPPAPSPPGDQLDPFANITPWSQERQLPAISQFLDYRDQALNSISLAATSRRVSEGRLG